MLRTALAAPVTLPLLPVSAYATPGNATDAAWAAYEAAQARYEATPDDRLDDDTLDRLCGAIRDSESPH